MSNLGKTGAGFSLPVDEARELLSRELALDIGPGDVTSQNVVEAASRLDCRLVAREPAVLCGVELFTMAFELVSKETRCELLAADGDLLEEGAEAARVSGAARDVLAAERTALNAVSHLSGVATLTRRFVDAVRGTEAAILDTRKTLPGLRSLQKYAVRAGGGRNHRMGLHDMVLVKDNHVAASGRTPAELARMASSAASVRGSPQAGHWPSGAASARNSSQREQYLPSRAPL